MIMAQSSSYCTFISPSKLQLQNSLPPFHAFKPPTHLSSIIPCRFNFPHTAPPLRLTPLFSSVIEEIVETSETELEFVEIGYVSDTHGLQGEIRVKHNTDFPELRLGKPGKRWLRQQYYGKENVLEVELVRGRGNPGNKSWVIKLSGFDDVDQARQLVGSTLLVNRSDRPELEEDEYYSRDLVGIRVIHKDTGETVGTVVNVFYNGGNDLLHVMLEASTGSSNEDTSKEETSESRPLIWIPFVEEIVPVVDLEKGEIQISPPKGLLELNVRSNEKSKKERRILDWRERKKIQRRLILAKKKLCDLEQEHMLHGLKHGEKSQRSFLAEQIVSVNSNLLQQALQTITAPINGCNVSVSKQDFVSWKNGKSLKISENYLTSVCEDKIDEHRKHRDNGVQLISEGKFATVLVVNKKQPENDHEANSSDFEDCDGFTISLVERLLVEMNNFLETEDRISMPIILISPAEDIPLLETLFASNDFFNFNSEKVKFLAEEKLPVVSSSAEDQKKNKVLMKSPWEILQTPTGSGGIITTILSNNVLEDLLQSGVEYIELCTLNERRHCGNPVFLGLVHSSKTEIGVMTFEDKIEFEDNFHVLLPIESMKKLATHIEKLSWHVELKSNSHVELVNKQWVEVISSTANSYEFRSSLESLLNTCSLDNACLVKVID